MGLFKPFSSCSSEDLRQFETPQKERRQDRSQNPDPRRFTIERLEERGGFLIVQIHYPNCTNYEGRKLLVYAGLTEKQLRQQSRLDPHFCEHAGHTSPVARFEPTEAGWHYARTVADECVPQEKRRE